MQKAEIKPRTEYAFREQGVSAVRSSVSESSNTSAGNKWKTEWIEPNPGQVHQQGEGGLLLLGRFRPQRSAPQSSFLHQDEENRNENQYVNS